MPEFAVILVEPKYEGNIGAIARVMANFGVSELVLVKPPKLGVEARKMSMHGLNVLFNAKTAPSLKKAKEDFDFLVATSAISATDKNSMRSPVTPEQLAEALKTSGKVGLVFGREDYGLYNTEVSLCDMLVTIPANSEYPTLNIAQSVTVILYELSRMQYSKKIRERKKFRRLSKIEKNVLLEKYDCLVNKVLFGDYERTLAKKTFRQLLGRAFVSGREAHTLIGVFRKAYEKIS
ncbi:MAG: RNA methyltransferase [Candidatus Altiarchaeota archaeon]